MQKRSSTEKRIFAALAALILTGFPLAVQAGTVTGDNGKTVIEDGNVTTGTLDGGLGSGDSIYGWYHTDETEASGGSVTIKGDRTEINGYIRGGASNGGNATHNEINIEGGNITSSNQHGIIGGYSSNGDATYNEINISGGEITLGSQSYAIIGGYAHSGEASYNEVNISDDANISGSRVDIVVSDAGTIAKYNSLSITGGNITASDAIYLRAGYSHNSSDNFENNTVYISGSANISGGSVTITGAYSSNATATATSNTVNIEGGKITSTSGNIAIYGGHLTRINSIVSSNKVNITGGEISSSGNINIVGGNGGSAATTVSNNEVNISGVSLANANIYGGYATSSGTVSDNKVTIKGENTTIAGAVYAGYSSNGTVKDNTITLKDGADVSNAELYGSNHSTSDTNNGNKLVIDNWSGSVKKVDNFDAIEIDSVTITNESVDTPIIMDVTGSGNLENTTVTIANVAFSRELDLAKDAEAIIIGGSGEITVGNTTVVVDDDDAKKDHIVNTENGVRVHTFDYGLNTNNNVVATVTRSVLAGYYTNDEDTCGDGTLTISDGFTTNASVVAGSYGAETNDATGGSLIVEGTENWNYEGDLYAGYSEEGNVSGNTLTVTGGDLSGVNLYGTNNWDTDNDSSNKLIVATESVVANTVANFDTIKFTQNGSSLTADNASNISGLDITEIDYYDLTAGDYVENETSLTYGYVTISDNIAEAIADNNSVEETLGGYVEYKEVDEGYIYGDRDNNGLYVNHITEAYLDIDGYESDTTKVSVLTDVTKTVITGVYVDEDGNTHTNSNTKSDTLTIDDNLETNASIITGSYAVEGQNATGGSLIVEGTGNYTGPLYGGYSENGNVYGNTLTVTGGEISNTLYAGWSNSDTGTVTGNTITITGTADITNATLYGSNFDATGANGNSLVIDGWSGTINTISNFDIINFANADFTDTDTLITLTETADLSNTSSIDITSFAGGQNLQQGEVYTLIANATGYEGTSEVSGLAGVAVNYDGTISQSDTAVVMTVDNVELNSQTDIITETGAAGAAFLNNGADLISDGLAILGRDELFGTKVFAAVQGVKSKYDMASRIQINGWNIIAGIGNESAHGEDKFSWAVFYEGGTGRFRTWNNQANELFYAKGSLSYNGGGIAAKYEANNGTYTEASVRAGQLNTSMNNALMDGEGNTYGYEDGKSYWGAHIGIGKNYTLSENRDLDIYAKYFHTDIDGDSFTVAGDLFDLSSITSDRLRIGARIISNKQSDTQGYYGVAWEYEFGGDAEMSVSGFSSKNSFGGSSYMAEAGFTWRPHYTSPWMVDMNLRGYTGEREGASLTVHVSYSF